MRCDISGNLSAGLVYFVDLERHVLRNGEEETGTGRSRARYKLQKQGTEGFVDA